MAAGTGGGRVRARISLLEIVLRVLLIYLFLLVAMRLFGKKEMGRWTPMEFLGMLLLARTVGPALTGGDPSLIPKKKAVASSM